MEVTIEKKGTFEHVMSVSIEASRVDELMEQEVSRLVSQVKMPGFRPGKTPKKLIESRYKDHIKAAVVDQLLQESYGKAMAENKANPADQPQVELGELNRGEAFTYQATYEQVPVAEPTHYTNFSLVRTSATVEESDVEKVIEQIRTRNTDYVAEEGRVAVSGDQMKFDFVGSVDGEEFDGGAAENHQLVLGSGQFIPGFEDQLIGHQAGADVEVRVTFPEQYQAEHLAGKEALFKCKVHEVCAPVKPEINDDLAVKAGVKEGGIDSLRKDIAERLRKEAASRSDSAIKRDLLDKLLEANPLEVPQGLIKREQAGMVEQLKVHYRQQGFDPAKLGMSDEEMGEGFVDEATKRVKVGMLLGAVARKESIEVTPEAVDALLDEMTAPYGDQAVAMQNWLRKDQERMEGVRSTALESAIIDWLIQHSSVEENSCSLEELMRENERSTEEKEESAGTEG